MRALGAILIALLCSSAARAGWVQASYVDEPGDPKPVGAAVYVWQSGCVKSGQYERAAVTSDVPTVLLEGLPDSGRCWFKSRWQDAHGNRGETNEAAYDFTRLDQVPPAPTAAPVVSWSVASAPPPPTTQVLSISQISRQYAFEALAVGVRVYSDRDFTFTAVPTEILGSIYIRPRNADKTGTTNPWLTFAISQPASIVVGWDTRRALPSWLSGWANTGRQLRSTDSATLQLYAKSFSAGQVRLGPNGSSTGSMYVVVVRP